MHSFAPLTVQLHPSRRLRAIQVVAHGVAGVSVILADVPIWLAFLLAAAIAVSLWRQWRRLPPHALILRDGGHFEKVGADGTASGAEVHPATVVTAALVVLVHRQQGRNRALTLLGDSLSPEDGRQLRLWLRWRAGPLQPA